MVLGFAVKTPLLNLYNLLPIYGDGDKLYSERGLLAGSSEPVVNRIRQHAKSICVLVRDHFSFLSDVCFH